MPDPNSAVPSSLAGTMPGAIPPPEATSTAQGGNLMNLQTVLRSALNEATQKKAEDRMKAVSPLIEGGAAPSVFTAALGLVKQGLQTSEEHKYSDVTQAYEKQLELMKSNPDNFRNVQGGIYDIKKNTWLLSPSDSSPSGKSLTRTDVKALQLPISLVGTSWKMFQQQLDSNVPASWFQKMVMQNWHSPLVAPNIPDLWEKFRSKFNDTFSDTGSSSPAFEEF